MELYENFKPRCSMETAYTIGYEQVSYNIVPIVRECYYNALSQCNINEFEYKHNVALLSVYMLGFLSGARAIRERKHLQQAKRHIYNNNHDSTI